MLETNYLNYVVGRFPGQVAKEINNQMPIYLNNNNQIQQILDTQKLSLRQQLEGTVKEILDRISNDPKYQEIINAHLTAIKHNAEQKLDKIDYNANKALIINQQIFNKEMENMKNNYENNISNLSEQLSELNKLKQEITLLKEKQRSDINKIHWIIGGTGVFCITLIAIAKTIKFHK
jgi:hypothetical protein